MLETLPMCRRWMGDIFNLGAPHHVHRMFAECVELRGGVQRNIAVGSWRRGIFNFLMHVFNFLVVPDVIEYCFTSLSAQRGNIATGGSPKPGLFRTLILNDFKGSL